MAETSMHNHSQELKKGKSSSRNKYESTMSGESQNSLGIPPKSEYYQLIPFGNSKKARKEREQSALNKSKILICTGQPDVRDPSSAGDIPCTSVSTIEKSLSIDQNQTEIDEIF